MFAAGQVFPSLPCVGQLTVSTCAGAAAEMHDGVPGPRQRQSHSQHHRAAGDHLGLYYWVIPCQVI